MRFLALGPGQGAIVAWGTSSPLGSQPTPRVLRGPISALRPRRIACGADHVVALTHAGEVYAWGANDDYQLGDGTRTARSDPARVEGIGTNTRVVQIACGARHTLALTDQGAVFSWGRVSPGRFTGMFNTRPARVLGTLALQVVRRIATTESSCLALTEAGEVHAWGWHHDVVTPFSAGEDPVPVRGELAGRRVIRIAAGFQHSLALTAEGEVYAWGSNEDGRLGDGTLVHRSEPVRVALPAPHRARRIAAGRFHSAILTARGAVLTWGSNEEYALGSGTKRPRRVPTPIGGELSGREAVRITAGDYHNAAVTRTGDVYVWGANYKGQLGTAVAAVKAPQPIGSLPFGAACRMHVAAGNNCCVAWVP